jgi:hypothetical protein
MMSDEATIPAPTAEAATTAQAPETAATKDVPATSTTPTTPSGDSIPRPVDVIRIEYTNLCARLGQLVYNLTQAELEKQDIIDEIFARVKEEKDLPESMKNVPVPPLTPKPPPQA